MESTLSRPVCRRASRMAFSLASAPPLVKNTLSIPSGASDVIRWAASPRRRFAVAGPMVARRAAWSAIAAVTTGCWWPMFTLTIWLAKSRYSRPAWSHTRQPRPPASTTGCSAACADQEWNTWLRSSS
ncbi:hypothetical protein APR12_003478 [Nocardia amikacinitolerans]|nr:hypothetical protein [Nocardia amikacinitolerans]